MANETELNELRERIGNLPMGVQLHLFELLLGDYRRKCEEARAAMAAANAAFLADEQLRGAAPTPFKFPPEAKREAG